jgi:uncharacterized protein
MGNPPRSVPRILYRMAVICFSGYLMLTVCMFCFQRSLLYSPRHVSPEYLDEAAGHAALRRWTNGVGERIGLQRPSPRQPAQGAVLITYGNGGTCCGCRPYVDLIQHFAQFDIFILEYPGYEDRPGKPSKAAFFAAADDAFRSLPVGVPIYLVGESLGTGVASHLAGTYPDRVRGMALISPFNNVTDVAQARYPIFPVKYMMLDRYSPEDDLGLYHGKVAVSVDGRDNIVPERFGRRLYDSYAGPKKLWSYPNGRHIQIVEPFTFWKEVIAFWRS